MIVTVAFTGSVKLCVRLLFNVSLNVTLNAIGVADCGVPSSTPADERLMLPGRPVADQV